MKRCIAFLFIFVFAQTAHADFLIVQRNGNLRAEPSTSSEVVERIRTGDTLLLLEADQSDAYYHVTAKQSGQEGWVFRTLVRKVTGDPDESLANSSGTVVDIRVLDVGAGLCTLIKLPGDKYVIYDAGSDAKLNGNRTIEQIHEYIEPGSTIELVVLSHTDADHINAAGQVLRDYHVKKLLWTGYDASMVGQERTAAYKRLAEQIAAHPAMENVNLHERDSTITPGNQFVLGGAEFSFLCGFGTPPSDWTGMDKAEKLNGVSIVMKLQFGNNSVLFCGDAVGRHRDDPENALIATEAFLVNHAGSQLHSTIIIAPHHGASNGSSTGFVDLVKPKVVIFSAGHQYHHPTARTANLYLQYTTAENIYRTDRGDDEAADEWPRGRTAGCKDGFDDDDIQVQLRSNGSYRVYYLTVNGACR